MKIIKNTTEFYIEEPTAVAIGKFDGFHCGHQKLLHKMQEQKEKGLATVVFTFTPSPAVYFSKESFGELTTIEEKRNVFEKAGIDYLIEYPFDQKIANMEPETFIKEVLVNRIHAKCIVAGEDVSFGRRGAGNYQLLSKKAKDYQYDVVIIEKVQYEGREISSTFVREEVAKGNMELVHQLLGVPYYVGGKIVHGRKLGRTLGMPTINQIPKDTKLLPPRGVYYSYVMYGDRKLPSITNIGVKPTVADQMVMGVETFIYDFKEDVYGEEVEVYLLHYKRAEMRFESVDALMKQMSEDIEEGRKYHMI
ncbi:MAG: bifunctional riboflavin kinase/FAD synthetase [Lachnospiraceae bacterium]|nr:bifunctional riboflavin kinase/FAD synthetase [Lachnospiraceae bacterium]MBQ6993384.1 bifunctional riboflavin kinase/FAD synthetase [Lachnospiraceae bacterium]